MNNAGDTIIGIDLGTTNSLVAFADQAGPRLIAGEGGENDVIVASVIGFDDAGRVRTIGAEARDHAVERPLTTVYSVKRLMGRGLADLAEDAERLAYRIGRKESTDGRDVAVVEVGDRVYTPPELSAMILRELIN
ncbi:MAG: Hsp70 family protein [Planctomycetes bacterium]|nr:Hsp70 family protein [Planctomycetota bacterium]